MRPDQGSLDSFNQIQDNNQMILRHILESPYPGASDHSSYSPMRLTLRASTADEDNFDEMQRAYNACMAVDTIKKVGVKPIQDLVGNLTRILAFGDSPSITRQDSKALSTATVFLERLGISSIFSFGDGADDKNPDTVVVFAGPRSRIGLPSPAYYLDEDTVKDYTSAMTQVLKGVLPSTKDSVDKLAAAVVDFESKIAAATPPLEDLQDATVSDPRM
jgi:endothelin-converting enzyme